MKESGLRNGKVLRLERRSRAAIDTTYRSCDTGITIRSSYLADTLSITIPEGQKLSPRAVLQRVRHTKGEHSSTYYERWSWRGRSRHDLDAQTQCCEVHGERWRGYCSGSGKLGECALRVLIALAASEAVAAVGE